MINFSRSSFIPKRVTINPKCVADPLVLQFKNINNTMRKIDAYVILGMKGKRKLKEDDDKINNKKKRRERENFLEKQRRANPINFIQGVLPKVGFLEAIKNFIFYTAMGRFVPFVLKNLPTILNATKSLIPVFNFVENFVGNVLTGVITAIDFGYSVHNKMRKILKDVTDSKFEKTFDELGENINNFLNLSIITGMLIGGAGVGKIFTRPKTKDVTVEELRKQAKEKGLRGYSKLNKKELITAIEKNKIPTKKPSVKIPFVGKFGRIFGRVPIIGGLMDFAISLLMGEKIGRATARAVGSTTGAFLGSFIPIPFAGTIIGGILGDVVGGALYDTIESFGAPKKMATGGIVGKNVTKIPRQIRAKKIQKPTRQITQKTTPGKNVGGKEAITKLFSDNANIDSMSPLRVLVKNSNIMKSGGIFGKFLSSGLELLALGQKIERPTLLGMERYLAYVIDSSIQEQSNVNSRLLASTMFAMAEGGLVPSNRTLVTKGDTTGSKVARDMMKSFTAVLNNKSSEIIQNIKKEISLFSPEFPKGVDSFNIEGMSGYGTPEEQALLKAIRYAEGTLSSYGVIFGGKVIQELADGKMTVKEVIEMGNTRRLPARFGGGDAGYGTSYDSSATGAYQFMPFTLQNLVNEGSLKPDELFTPELQDKAALILAKKRGVTSEDLKREGLSSNISNKLAPEWASFPTKSGSSYYRQPVKNLSSLQKIYKESLQQPNLTISDRFSPMEGNPISVGLELLKQGFTVAENMFFTKTPNPSKPLEGFNPLGTSSVGRHSNSADHSKHSLDVTDFRGKESEGIERLKHLFKRLYANREKLGINELIFDPVGYWFEGMKNYSTTPYGGHHNHLHVRFKSPATKSTVERVLRKRNLGVVSSMPSISPSIQYISKNRTYNDYSKKTKILLQPILT